MLVGLWDYRKNKKIPYLIIATKTKEYIANFNASAPKWRRVIWTDSEGKKPNLICMDQLGYLKRGRVGHGKLLVPDEPKASFLKEAFEGYATKRFESPTEIKRFLENQPDFPKDKHGEVHLSRIAEWLAHPIYAGRVSHERWGIHMVEGKHEALISLETWKRNQDRFHGRTKADCKAIAPTRRDTRPDFPLRGFVTCCGCGTPLTAAWSKGRSAKHGYYFCQTKGCPERRKNIRKAEIEGEFDVLLQSMTPDQPLVEIALDMLKDLWDAKSASLKETRLRTC